MLSLLRHIPSLHVFFCSESEFLLLFLDKNKKEKPELYVSWEQVQMWESNIMLYMKLAVSFQQVVCFSHTQLALILNMTLNVFLCQCVTVNMYHSKIYVMVVA